MLKGHDDLAAEADTRSDQLWKRFAPLLFEIFPIFQCRGFHREIAFPMVYLPRL